MYRSCAFGDGFVVAVVATSSSIRIIGSPVASAFESSSGVVKMYFAPADTDALI